MVKKIDNHDIKHKRNLKLYEAQIDAIYHEAIREAVSISDTVAKVNTDKPFSFDEYPITRKRIDDLLSGLKSKMETIVMNGIKAEWTLANDKNNIIVSKVFGRHVDKLTPEQQKKYFSTNDNAMKAFQQRKVGGLNLSDRVWRYTEQFKEEIEMGLDIGIRSGRSANEMSRDLRQYLKHPDKLFRRVRDEHGQLHLSKNAKAFHPGQGVYRSSYKNARRLASTETNIAYRTSDHLRWQQMDFVVGIEIHLSNNHTLNGKPFHDICDELAGSYPKNFKFTGWHPHCRCFATSILKTQKEMDEDTKKILKGEPTTSESENTVKDVPEAFKDWILNNKSRIETAVSMPYFISDNQDIVDDILNPKPKPLTTIEKARLRQQNRTAEQIQNIKKLWEERKKKQELIRKAAANILKVAKDYGEVDYEELQKIVSTDDLNKMKSVTKIVAKAISEMKKQEQDLLDIIPNVHEWHKQFTIKELKVVHEAVKKKLASWNVLTLSEQAKKLKFEVEEYFGTDKYGVQTKFKTWSVAQDAYKMRLDNVQYLIAKQEIETSISQSLSFAKNTKSAKVKQLASELQLLLGDNATIEELQSKADILNNEVAKLEAAKIARGLKKLSKLGSGFTPNSYTQERKDKAVWDKGDGKIADNTLIDVAAKNWIASTEDEKDRVYEYTYHYCNVNEPLQGRRYLNYQTRTDFEHRVNNITSYISKNILPKDMWFMRGDDGLGVIASRIKFAGGTMPNDLQDLVGMTMQEGGFMSTGSRKGRGFSSKSVIINVYAPKGTQAAYIEPISKYGNGAGRNWDGNQRFSSFSSEHETLFQRGTIMRITKVYQEGEKTYIDCEVIGQEIKPLSYVLDSNIGY